MSISSIASTTHSCSPDVQNPFAQRAQDFKALSNALQSGDLASAQQAFDAFQQNIPNNPSSQTGQNSNQTSPLGKNLQALQSALQSGDLSGAQQAFATLKQDMQSARKAHGHHHHHHSSGAGATSSTNPAPTEATADSDPSGITTIDLLA